MSDAQTNENAQAAADAIASARRRIAAIRGRNGNIKTLTLIEKLEAIASGRSGAEARAFQDKADELRKTL